MSDKWFEYNKRRGSCSGYATYRRWLHKKKHIKKQIGSSVGFGTWFDLLVYASCYLGHCKRRSLTI